MTYVFGAVANRRDLNGIPSGARARIRIRAGRFAHVFIRRPHTISRHIIQQVDDHWEPGPCIQMRVRK